MLTELDAAKCAFTQITQQAILVADHCLLIRRQVLLLFLSFHVHFLLLWRLVLLIAVCLAGYYHLLAPFLEQSRRTLFVY